MKKKKIILHSNHCRMKTGFGKHMKHLLTYLSKDKKYDIVEFANGRNWNDPTLSNMPWKAKGSLPTDPATVAEVNQDKNKQRKASYGHYKVDDIIKTEKPDIYLGIEDIWGLEGFWKKKWWKKINSIIWTPIDSLPLLDKHIDAATHTSNLIVQASFAKKALEEKGFKNVHLLPVPIDTDNFYKLDPTNKSALRQKHNINEDDFIIGFVFRNQLRKSVPALLEGFKIFKNNHPDCKAKLLLHTHWGEGWGIAQLMQEKGIKPEEVLTTYFCDKCKQYEIKPFSGQDLNCKFCGSEKSQQTSQIHRGPSESELNEIYNLMDVYCHPFTSGGQEIPIQEAKLTELITLVTNYSCGEDYCTEDSGGLPLDWTEYREPGTQFIKAATQPTHIAQQLSHVHSMDLQAKVEAGKKARQFVIDFCSINSVCSKFEEIISNLKPSEWDFDFSYVEQNPKHIPIQTQNHRDWIIDLYSNILKVEDPAQNDPQGIKHWEHRLATDLNRQQVYDHFVKTAVENNSKNKTIPFKDILSKDDEGKRILFVLNGNDVDVFNSTALLPFIKNEYPDYNIYYATKTKHFPLLASNPHIHQMLEYNSAMDDFIWSEGQGSHEGFFEFTLMPDTNSDKHINFIHGNKHPLKINLNYA